MPNPNLPMHQRHRHQHHHFPRTDQRPFRPPDHHHSTWRPRPRPRPPFSVVLLRPRAAAAAAITVTAVTELIDSLPSSPAEHVIPSSGRVAARLFFASRAAAADAAVSIWYQRLEGLHLLTPLLEPPNPTPELDDHMRALFAAHASRLLHSDAVRHYEGLIADVDGEVKKVVKSLAGKNRLAAFEHLQEKKKGLEAEKEQMEAKLAEFKAAMEHIVSCLRGDVVREEVEVEVFKIGEELDYRRVHNMMLRECRRLKEGLPIYAYRRRILNHIFANQVLGNVIFGYIISRMCS